MTRTRTPLVLAAALACLMAVATMGPVHAAPAKKNPTLIITVLPGQVRLNPGEAVAVRLSTNLTTGYSWTPKVTGTTAAVKVSKGTYLGSESNLVGAPGTTEWTITAMSEGTAKVKFLATPPGGGTPVNDGTLTVIVQ